MRSEDWLSEGSVSSHLVLRWLSWHEGRLGAPPIAGGRSIDAVPTNASSQRSASGHWEKGARTLVTRRNARTAGRRAAFGSRAAAIAVPQDTVIHPGPPGAAAGDGTVLAEPEALVVSRWFDPGASGAPYAATVRFSGRRTTSTGKVRAEDQFVQDEAIDRVVPGAGPVAITSWVYGLRPGEWAVEAELVGPESPGRARPKGPAANRPAMHRAAWSWRRWRVSDAASRTARTRWALLAPLAATPAVLPGAYPALAALAFLVALLVQGSIAATLGLSVDGSLAVSLLAILVGLLGAKLWYAVLHPGESILRGGWAVDGFLVIAPIAAILALHVLAWPIGTFLDAATPGIFFAVAIGRVGCFLSGCCAGRITTSRWALWSSDRRVAARRIPTQLIESASGLAIGVASFWLVVQAGLPHGVIFAGAFVAYAILRQLLLRLRAERRISPRTVPLSGVAASGMVAAALVMSLTHVGG